MCKWWEELEKYHGEARKDEVGDTEAADRGLAPAPGGVAPGLQKGLPDCHKGTLLSIQYAASVRLCVRADISLIVAYPETTV